MNQPVIAEKWRKIPGFKWFYEVSNLGNVRSWSPPASGRMLAKRPHSVNGLPEVKAARKGGKRRSVYVRELVARAFPEGES
ncbi:NUMOD4 domain-containing protein [Streptomyces bottropensis]|uniref:NUMOD4 domain-containing protein n=1 Tax=Streptomyces bottropensis TaxID=42235 RepID=UPI00367F4973